ncbi:hypothetical protein AST99_08680 [Formosa algae]|nr:hypothetical protein AST99_08680 [Formosa algae]
MPISDNSNYEKGHFHRVYEHIIKPACDIAGFKPVRADDVLSTNHIALDIIKKIIDSDMALCDLSSQNPNVLYELGIRQAFDKPVTLIKDSKTKRIFDIQGFRDLEYDESLRIDSVEEIIDLVAENLKSTYKQQETEINSLVRLLGITPAELKESTKISIETELILNNLNSINNRLENLENKKKNTLQQYVIMDDDKTQKNKHDYGESYSIKEFEDLKKGDKVAHNRFGIGKVVKIEGKSTDLNSFKGTFEFENGSTKKLLLRFAQMYKVL